MNIHTNFNITVATQITIEQIIAGDMDCKNMDRYAIRYAIDAFDFKPMVEEILGETINENMDTVRSYCKSTLSAGDSYRLEKAWLDAHPDAEPLFRKLDKLTTRVGYLYNL